MSSEAPPPVVSSDSASPGKVCPSCGTEYPFESLFCPRDGANLIVAVEGTDLIGQVIGERYHVLRRLGEGGMGRVYLAEHISMARMCAIKVMHPSLRTDAEAVGRFRREAANAGRINHVNVAGMYDCGETSDRLIYLAMEYVPGDSLSALLKWNGALPPRRAVGIAAQVADGLAAAHKLGIVHRDLKPDNVIIARSKDGDDLAKVVDFGIAKATQGESQTVTRTGFVVGTYHYMSPEQMIGEAVDGRSDLYSLGCILYEMLVGKRLFEGSTGEAVFAQRLTQPPPRPKQENPAVSKALDDVVVKLLARSREERFGSAEEVRDALLALPTEPSASLGRRFITPLRALSAKRTAGDPQPRSEPDVTGGAARPTSGVGAAPDVELRSPTRTVAPPSASRRGWIGGGGVLVAGIVGVLLFAAGRKGESLPAADVSPVPSTELLPSATAAPERPTGPSAIEPAPRRAAADAPPPSAARPASSTLERAPAADAAGRSPQPPRGEGTPTASSTAGAAERPRQPAPQRAPSARATPVAAPAARRPSTAALDQVRTRIEQARAAANRGAFAQSLALLRSNQERIAALRAEFPDESSIRALSSANREAVASIRKSCEALAIVAVESGDSEIPTCN